MIIGTLAKLEGLGLTEVHTRTFPYTLYHIQDKVRGTSGTLCLTPIAFVLPLALPRDSSECPHAIINGG